MMQKTPAHVARVQVQAIDLAAARVYLAGLRELAAEASASPNPRVVRLALGVLQQAPATIRMLSWRAA